MDYDDEVTRDRAVERIRLELVTRKFMVMVLAMIGVWVGIAVILSGAPSFMEQWFSPWSRYYIGGAALIGGIATTVGGLVTDRTWRGWVTQVVGLSVLVLWYAFMGVAYVGLLTQEGLAIVGPGEPLDASSTGRGYVPLVYLGLMLMTATPLVTMIRLRRPGVYGPLDH